jgi:hypothetical protein
LLLACGTPPPVVVAKPLPPEPPAFSAGSHMARFHSTRFDVSLPLPDGKAWRIDDHHAPVLRATHAATESLVELAVWREDELVNRAKCEARAHEKALAPEPAGDEISTEVVAFPPGWDTGIWIGADHDAKDITGELFAFGAFVHKCMYFRFVTKAPLRDADTISDRLAFARLRIFGGLALDSFDVPRVRR